MFLLPDLLTKVYKGILLSTFMRAQLQKLFFLDKRVLKLTSHGQTRAENKLKIHAVVLVKKRLYSELVKLLIISLKSEYMKKQVVIMISCCKSQKIVFNLQHLVFVPWESSFTTVAPGTTSGWICERLQE